MGNVIAFRRANDPHEQRRGPDRRSTRRGGRRDGDKKGFAPLVLLLDDNEDLNARCEAILARLHFAVAPTRSIDEASRVMDALRPDIIVARVADAAALRRATAADLPIVLLNDDLLDPEVLIEEIRQELRRHRPPK
ncbi:MAG TPA: response regulator [Vicinamibacterales bacterium]|nr:response regulator [Vicinamibacterales bacterium]